MTGKTFTRLISFLLALGASHASSIQSWILDNVETDLPPYVVDETYRSTVYTDSTKVTTYGGVLWKESSVQSPGMKAVTDGDPTADPESCIMTSGEDPENPGDPKQCNDDFQTSKRVKVYTEDLLGPVDLVYEVNTDVDPSDNVYRFFLKYINLSNFRIKSFKIQLGTGTGDGFTPSIANDGLSFATRSGVTVDGATVGSYSDSDLAAFFAFGLFGDADSNPQHDSDGYYDPVNRGNFDMAVNNEDEIEATEVSSNVANLYDGTIAAWIPEALAPLGYFFDMDDDPDTDPVIVADFDENWQTYRLCSDAIAQEMITLGVLEPTECRASVNDEPVAISASTLSKWTSGVYSTRFTSGPIEDFGNVNVNTHIKIGDFTQPTFTVRIIPTMYFLPVGGGGGDPHFLRWSKDRRDSFHGECDIVVLHAPDFHQEGLDFHVRTTIGSYFSYIESAALRLGEDTLEVRNGNFVWNGNEFHDDTLPITMGKSGRYHFSLYKTVQENENKIIRRNYRLTLDDNSAIEFRFYKEFMTFQILGHPDFAGSAGILGAYPFGEMIGRHGNLIKDFAEYGFEWQVNPDDPILFSQQREPQLPYEACRLPTLPRPSRRALRGNTELLAGAEKACSQKAGSDFDLCVSDVLMTGDLGLAEEW